LFKQTASLFGISVETLDIDPELKPDHVGSAAVLPFAENDFAAVCAFQILEHMPYAEALGAFAEMVRVSSRFVIISLPDAKPMWRFMFPRFASRGRLIPRPFHRLSKHEFDGEHHWEVNKEGYALERVTRELQKSCQLDRTYRPFDNPYHRFFVFRKEHNCAS
jgi:hypothetical protein